ncbi:MAG: energy transducer TonB [Bacteroidota bacterium]
MKKYGIIVLALFSLSPVYCQFLTAAMDAEESLLMLEQKKPSGTVIGTVIDIADRNPIANATVEILGSSLKTETAATGQFTIVNVPKGFYQLRAMAKGYSPSVQNNLYVDEGKEHTAFFMLKKEGVKGEENSANTAPVPISTKSPAYPDEARKNGVEGIFYFKVLITENGSIKFAECIKKNVYAESGKLKDDEVKKKYPQAINQMEKEALEAVWQWKFKPAMKDGKAIEAEVMLPIKYKLS